MKSIDWLIRWVPQKILVFKLKKIKHLEICNHTLTNTIYCTITIYKITPVLYIWQIFGEALFHWKAKPEKKKKFQLQGRQKKKKKVFSPFFLWNSLWENKPKIFVSGAKNKAHPWLTPDNVFCKDAAVSKFRGCFPWEFGSGKLCLFPSLRAPAYYFNNPISIGTSPYLLEKIKSPWKGIGKGCNSWEHCEVTGACLLIMCVGLVTSWSREQRGHCFVAAAFSKGSVKSISGGETCEWNL